jgi:hypothetical protein
MTTNELLPDVIGWHRHRWTPWSEPFATVDGDGKQVEDQQERHCIRCGLRQRTDVRVRVL